MNLTVSSPLAGKLGYTQSSFEYSGRPNLLRHLCAKLYQRVSFRLGGKLLSRSLALLDWTYISVFLTIFWPLSLSSSNRSHPWPAGLELSFPCGESELSCVPTLKDFFYNKYAVSNQYQVTDTRDLGVYLRRSWRHRRLRLIYL